jgi:hypothetical protein
MLFSTPTSSWSLPRVRRLLRPADLDGQVGVRALGLITLNDSLLRGQLSIRTKPVRVRVLLLDPESPSAVVRSLKSASLSAPSLPGSGCLGSGSKSSSAIRSWTSKPSAIL